MAIDEDDVPGYLHDMCKDWIERNEIQCAESIWQVDSLTIKSVALVEKICDLIGYYKPEDDEDI